MSLPTTTIQYYRHLLRWGLKAVQYSSPARYIIHDKIRKAFETPTSSTKIPHPERLINTITFLKLAAKQVGREHKLVRNLCLVSYFREHHQVSKMLMRKDDEKLYSNAMMEEYDKMIQMLNETMDLALR